MLHVLANRLAVPLAALVLLVLIGRTSPALLGEYAVVMSFYWIMQTLPLLGLTSFVLREVARDPGAARAWFATIGLLAVASACAVGLGAEAAVAALGYAPGLVGAIRIVAVSIVPGILVFIAELVLIALGRARPVSVLAVAENLARLAASALVLARGGGIEALMWVLFAGRMASFLVHLALVARLPPPPGGRLVQPAILRATWAVLPAFLAGGALTVIAGRIDFIVLSVAEPIEHVGYYGIAYRAYEIGLLAAAAVLTSLFPGLARAWHTGPEAFAARVRLLFRVQLGAAMCLALLGAAWAPLAIQVVFPLEYPHPNRLAQLFFLLLVPGLSDQFLAGVLNAADRQRRDAAAMAWGAGTLVAGLLLLVPALHLLGAWLAMLLGVLVQGAVRLAAVRDVIGPLMPAREALRWLACGALVALPAGVAAAPGGHAGQWWLTLLGAAVLPALLLGSGALAWPRGMRTVPWRKKPMDSGCAT